MLPTVAATLPLGIYDLAARNQHARTTIENYATGHALMDTGIGLAGFLPFPGAAPAAILAALAAQIPVYASLAQDLRSIYPAMPVNLPIRQIGLNLAAASALTVGANVAVQLGMEFLNEIKSEIFEELGWGFAASWIPIIGGFASTMASALLRYHDAPGRMDDLGILPKRGELGTGPTPHVWSCGPEYRERGGGNRLHRQHCKCCSPDK